ncbi:uncharacterized protein PITG_04043 [Phytophthora infestans T30-4]|uniref:Uncharacterized protein n=1 Tax=Phytophthora infestans (strain T30-4) TaxID=403677 RepID=D0N0E8_PHYIT|nr:uncharacterized protein PITG_04043 [Phytophthora infestans T30-4]EEY67111.1 conserved hypothetical protein [Phytophthora infestans T30-4]|eukprot:XP_002905759.1 conserved hypothetical protein [Phytophthora infestans T30-4]
MPQEKRMHFQGGKDTESTARLKESPHRDKANGEEGYPKVVKLLLENGAEVDKLGTDGATALLLACQDGSTKTVRALLKFSSMAHQ